MHVKDEEEQRRMDVVRAALSLAAVLLEGPDRIHATGQAAERLQDAYDGWLAHIGATDDA